MLESLKGFLATDPTWEEITKWLDNAKLSYGWVLFIFVIIDGIEYQIVRVNGQYVVHTV